MQTQLESLEALVTALAASAASESAVVVFDAGDLNGRVRTLQQQFQAQILPLAASELPPELAVAWQALQTELHRNLRLLQTETLHLQAARQPQTQQQRLQTVRDRLDSAISQVRSVLEA
ncbi:MAG: heterocyst frequency control protein PatD [Cyanobacteria bacterium J06641_5]